MPKLKTSRAAAKRFKKTGTGKNADRRKQQCTVLFYKGTVQP